MHLKKFLKYTEKLIVIVLRLYFPLFKKIFSLLQIHHSFYLLLSALGLQCCAQAFSGCSERALLFVAVLGCLTVVSSLVEHRLQALRLHWLQHTSSVVMAHRLSCFATCGIFLDQQSNLCSLHWEANSVLPGKSTLFFFPNYPFQHLFFFLFFLLFIFGCVGSQLHRVGSLLWHTGSLVVVLGLSCSLACGILVSLSGIKLVSLALQGGFLTSRQSRKSQIYHSQTGFLK